jgi:hypothetical protein
MTKFGNNLKEVNHNMHSLNCDMELHNLHIRCKKVKFKSIYITTRTP